MKLKENKVIAVDFDGIIAKYEGDWNGPEYVGELKESEHPKECLNILKDIGFTIVIYTCRSELEPVKSFLDENEIPHHHVNKNPHQPDTISENKMYAWKYIDDQNASFVSLEWSMFCVLRDAYEEDLLEFEEDERILKI